MRLIFARILLGITTLLIVSHNLIPHNHQEVNAEIVDHHGAGHSHDVDHSHNDEPLDLNDILSHLFHNSDDYIINKEKKAVISDYPYFAVVSYNKNCLHVLTLPPIIYYSPPDDLLYTPRNVHSSGLRAPPAC
jgi:hypothetical protein